MPRTLLCVLLATGACSTHKVVVTGGEIHTHLGELRRANQAQVEVQTETDTERTVRSTETLRFDRWLDVDGHRRRIDDLAYLCPDAPPAADAPIPDDNRCELITRRNDSFVLRTISRRAPLGQIAQGVAVGAVAVAFVGGLACAFACDMPYQAISIVTISGLIVAALVSCARTAGCHD